MGLGRSFTCEKCGLNFDEYDGIGYAYPIAVEKAINNGKAGKLGKEVKEFFEKYPDGTLNCESIGFVCKTCGGFRNDSKYTMYAPKEGITNFSPFCMPQDLHKWYKVYKHYSHKCAFCGGDMKMLTANAKVKCPICGIEMKESKNNICWD